MKAKQKEAPIMFEAQFEDKKKTRKSIPALEVNDFIRTEKRKYSLTNHKGETIFRKTYEG